MVVSRKVRVVGLSVIILFVLYLLLGFFAVPALVKSQLKSHVREKLGHQLELAEVKFNPLALSTEVSGFDLREANGGTLIAFKRLFVNFQARSLYERAWTFAEVSLDAPAINGELRTDGTHNFSALLAALRDPEPRPDAPPPRLIIDRIAINDGRVDLADLQGGEAARLRLAPLTFELTHLSTLPEGKSPYKLTARSADGELLQWGGEISLNPVASSGRLALSKWRVATLARLLGERIAIDAPSGEIEASLSYRAGYAQGRATLAISELDFKLAQLKLTPAGAAEPLAAVETLGVSGASLDLASRSIVLERVALDNARVALVTNAEGRGNWGALDPGGAPAPEPSATGPAPAPPAPAESAAPAAPIQPSSEPAAAPAPWRIKLGELAVSQLALAYADRRPATQADVALDGIALGLSGEFEQRTGAFDAHFGAIKLTAAGVRLGRADLSASATDLALGSDAVRLQHGAQGLEVDAGALSVALAGMGLRQGKDELRMRKFTAGNRTLRLSLPGGTSDGPLLALEGLVLDGAGIGARLASAKADALDLKTLSAGAATMTLGLGTQAPEVKAAGLFARLAALSVRDPASGSELARLGSAEAQGGTLDLRNRQAGLERLLLADGHAATVVGSDGRLNWDGLLAATAGAPGKAPPTQRKPAPGAPWKATIKTAELRNFGAAYSDEREKLALAVQAVNARARDLGTDAASAAQIELEGRVKDGGQFSANGRVNLHSLRSDLKVKLSEISLLPAQPLIARHTQVELRSALASADGRVRYNPGAKAGDAAVLFEGELALAKVAVDETDTKQPFLTLDALRAGDLRLALAPNRLEIPDLRITGLATKLLIAEDQSVNVARLLRARADPGKPATAPPAEPPTGTDASTFPISISRIRIDQTRLEFSDLSLRPQFATRMHELQGVVTGISTARDSRAQLELDARVDEFGSARIKGEINPFQPRAHAEIAMAFRNLAMTSLTPYSAKFAGYRIASGQLSMDLAYRIKNGALVGENKLVLDKLELGERVESPTALNLPLELAIAILKDSDGRIDIGLPVSGSLDDPQFSYGALIWKAIGNLLTRIVTAPFRALASLFGGGGETLGAIEFDPGGERLLPPERQKLRTVAEALQKRPQLSLTVKPAYAPQADRPALQSLAVRRAVTERAGIKLAPGEAPGPLDHGNARVQQAIQALFEERFGAPAARDLRAGMQQASTAQTAAAEAGKPAPKPAVVPPSEIARAMAERLIGAFDVEDTALVELAKRRGEAIAQELRDAGKVDPARLAIGAAVSADAGAGKPVVTELELGVAK